MRRLLIPLALFGLFAAGILMHAAEPQKGSAPRSRMIDFLPLDSIVRLSFRDGMLGEIVLLEEQSLRRHKEARAKYEALEKENIDVQEKLARLRKIRASGGPSGRTQLWKVVSVGEDFVRLEPEWQLPGQEKVSWIVLPQSSIPLIKSKP